MSEPTPLHTIHTVPDSPLLTITAAAKILRVSDDTVYNLCRAKQIPALRVGRQWRIRQASLERWMDQQEHAADPPADGVRP